MHRIHLLITAALLLGLDCLSGSAHAGARFSATTAYLTEPLERARRITLSGELGGAGELFLDPNHCSLNIFGDPLACTLIAPLPVTVKIVKRPDIDPSGKGRELYELEGAGLPGTLYLVLHAADQTAARLVFVAQDNKGIRPLPLQVTELGTEPDPVAGPGLAPNEQLLRGEFTAVQMGDQVYIFAVGVVPTAGWQPRLQQLPIRIYPPQYRLVSKQPEGPVAQVISTFSAVASFSAAEPIQQVILHDVRGRHEIKVIQLDE